MRPLTEQETEVFFEKLTKYIGQNLLKVIENPEDPHCFRLHGDRIYYIRESVLRVGSCVSRKNLVSLGTCMGKMTHSGKFHLHVTALEVLAKHATFKVWVKPSAELSFLYGNHVLKAGVGRITDNTPQNQGVCVYSMADIPLGFGTTARSTQEVRHADPASVVVYHQADVGEYLRGEIEPS